MQTLCQLDYAAGHVRRCPGDTCPLWVDDHCAVARHWEDFGSDEYLAKLLRDLRSDLARRNPSRAVRQFHPPGFA
jgi:hypothetical protein